MNSFLSIATHATSSDQSVKTVLYFPLKYKSIDLPLTWPLKLNLGETIDAYSTNSSSYKLGASLYTICDNSTRSKPIHPSHRCTPDAWFSALNCCNGKRNSLQYKSPTPPAKITQTHPTWKVTQPLTTKQLLQPIQKTLIASYTAKKYPISLSNFSLLMDMVNGSK